MKFLSLNLSKNKGVSGVVATIVLIALTLVLVGIVWAVVNGIINERTKSPECLDILEKVKIDDYYTCMDSGNNQLKIGIYRGNVSIDGIIVVMYGESSSLSFSIPSSSYGDLPSENSVKTYIVDTSSSDYSSKVGTLSSIKISPKIGDYQCDVSDSLPSSGIINCNQQDRFTIS